MPLSDANFIQENSGNGTTVTLGSGTTAGNTVVILAADTSTSPTQATFLTVKSNGSHQVMVKSEVPAGESSWALTGANTYTSWYVAELSNIDQVDPMDTSASGGPSSVGNGGTLSTGTTPLNAGLSTVAFAMFGGQHTGTTSWAGYTNGFEEIVDISTVAGTAEGLAVARKFTEGTTGTFQSTGTLTTSGAAALTYATMVVFRAVDSPIVAPLDHFVGFEWGTHGGGSASGTTSMFGGMVAPGGTWGTNYLIQAGSARNSSYGLRIVQSASTGYVRAGNLGGVKSCCAGFNVRVVSATGTPVVASLFNNALTAFAQVLYDSSTTKFGVWIPSTGTVSWATTTTALNTWVWIDIRLKTTTSTYHAEWRMETGTNTYTDQPAADLAGQTPGLSIYQLQLGHSSSQTMTADFDDVLLSRYYAAYPLGPHEVKLLTVDPAGTPTVSGTTTNFSVFTANGTLAAWNAANARNAVDEVPVTISASADGVTQTVAAASDYMQFPMSTYTCTATEFINGVRMMSAIGSGAGSGAGDIAIRGHDGTTETALATVSQLTPGSPTALSSTAPLWRCAMWQSTNGWTQAELDAAALRAGFSADATPDMWVHVLYLEVAIGRTRTRTLFGDLATVEEDPTRLGVVSVTVDAPTMGTGDTELVYEEAGSPTTVNVPEGTVVTEQTNATFEADVNRITVEWPPEPDPIA